MDGFSGRSRGVQVGHLPSFLALTSGHLTKFFVPAPGNLPFTKRLINARGLAWAPLELTGALWDIAEKNSDTEQKLYFDRLKHREDLPNFREDLKLDIVLPKQRLLELSLPAIPRRLTASASSNCCDHRLLAISFCSLIVLWLSNLHSLTATLLLRK